MNSPSTLYNYSSVTCVSALNLHHFKRFSHHVCVLRESLRTRRWNLCDRYNGIGGIRGKIITVTEVLLFKAGRYKNRILGLYSDLKQNNINHQLITPPCLFLLSFLAWFFSLSTLFVVSFPFKASFMVLWLYGLVRYITFYKGNLYVRWLYLTYEWKFVEYDTFFG